MHDFFEVDVFGTGPFTGNPLAVVAGAGDLSDEQMARIAAWTNSSETTFLLPPSDERADYRVRVRSPSGWPGAASCRSATSSPRAARWAGPGASTCTVTGVTPGSAARPR